MFKKILTAKMLIKNVWLIKVIATIVLIILLAGAVYAIFNGIIEIIEGTLGNIMGFLSDPLGFLGQFAQDAYNGLVDIFDGRMGMQYSMGPSETCTFFIDSEMVDELAENLSGNGTVNQSELQAGLEDANGNPITYDQYIKHAKKAGDFFHDTSGFILSKWHSGNPSGGDINAYTQAINILWYKDYKTYEVYNVVVKNNPEWKTKQTVFQFDSEKSNEYFGIKREEISRTVNAVKKALSEGKVVTAITNSDAWNDNNGNHKSWPSMHWGVIFYYDGKYFHMKGGGSRKISDGIYTEEELKTWLKKNSSSIGKRWRKVFALGRADGSTFNEVSNTAVEIKSMNEVLMIGDSITVGLQYTDELKGAEFCMASGSTVDDWLNDKTTQWGKKTYSTLPADSDKIKAISIMLGTNDSPNKDSDMEKLIEKLHKKYPNKPIIVQKILPINGTKQTAYNNKLEKICNKLDYAFCVDSTKGVNGFEPDGIHPNDAGNAQLAKNIKKNLLDLKINMNSSSGTSIIKGALDLKATGLTKQTIREMILASYVTQATTDTLIGVEAKLEDLDEVEEGFLDKLIDSYNNSSSEYGSIKKGKYEYIIVKNDEDEYKVYQAERGIVKILDNEGNTVTCYKEETFDKLYNNWAEEGASGGAGPINTLKNQAFYTVPELGKIKVLSGGSDEYGGYYFSEQELDYSTEPEIQSALIPFELLTNFLDISASIEFLHAFEELVKDQEIVVRLASTVVEKEIVTDSYQEGTASADVSLQAKYVEYVNPTASGSGNTPNEIDDSGEGTIDLGQIMVKNHNERTEVEVKYDLVLEKANTWFMKAEREFNTSSVTTTDTVENPIPENDLQGDGAEAFLDESVGLAGDRLINDATSVTNVANQLNMFPPGGYYRDDTRSEVTIISSSVHLYEGTETVTTTTTTDTYTKGTMKYNENYEGFLGLWANKDGKYHEYADDNGNINKAALYKKDGKNKKVGYKDLYNDNDAKVGDLFENADEMLFELLEMTENTQKFSYIMRWMLYNYTDKDYGVTDFESLLRLIGITTLSVGDYNVNTKSSAGERLKIVEKDGKTAEENLIEGVKSISNPSYKAYCMVYVNRGYCKELIRLQEKYGVNPAWIIAQSYYETQCGTTGSGPAPVNNWWGWDVYGGHTHAFPSPVECFEQICKQLADPSYSGYFQDGKETIDAILEVWCPAHDDEYPAVCKEIVHDILTGAGIEVSGFNGDFLEIAKQVHDFVQSEGYTYGGGIPPNGSKLVDCSGYVCAVLREYGFTEFGDGSNGIRSTYNMWDHISGNKFLGYPEWSVHDASEMEAGDILLRHGHTAIYIGDGLTYDCGATDAIQSGPVSVTWGAGSGWLKAIRVSK